MPVVDDKQLAYPQRLAMRRKGKVIGANDEIPARIPHFLGHGDSLPDGV
jgi:hypothetical protein